MVAGVVRHLRVQASSGRQEGIVGIHGIWRCFVVRWQTDTDTVIAPRHQLAGADQSIPPVVAGPNQNQYRIRTLPGQ